MTRSATSRRLRRLEKTIRPARVVCLWRAADETDADAELRWMKAYPATLAAADLRVIVVRWSNGV